MMTRQDFIALADAVRDIGLTCEQIAALADFCKEQNPRFNRSRWIRYVRGVCGPHGGER